MACRIVEDCGANVKKRIPLTDELKKLTFPDIFCTEDKLTDFIYDNKINKYYAQAIEQQYHEIWLYEDTASELLAPQLDVKMNIAPEIIYPKFLPLATSGEVWSYNDEDSLILLGWRAHHLGIKLQDIINFSRAILNFCNCYDLQERDTIYNPSNIGYNYNYGLRLIDYGLLRAS